LAIFHRSIDVTVALVGILYNERRILTNGRILGSEVIFLSGIVSRGVYEELLSILFGDTLSFYFGVV
jgi:hypothetical protein